MYKVGKEVVVSGDVTSLRKPDLEARLASTLALLPGQELFVQLRGGSVLIKITIQLESGPEARRLIATFNSLDPSNEAALFGAEVTQSRPPRLSVSVVNAPSPPPPSPPPSMPPPPPAPPLRPPLPSLPPWQLGTQVQDQIADRSTAEVGELSENTVEDDSGRVTAADFAEILAIAAGVLVALGLAMGCIWALRQRSRGRSATILPNRSQKVVTPTVGTPSTSRSPSGSGSDSGRGRPQAGAAGAESPRRVAWQ